MCSVLPENTQGSRSLRGHFLLLLQVRLKIKIFTLLGRVDNGRFKILY